MRKKLFLCVLAIVIFFTLFLYGNHDIGIPASAIQSDIRSAQKITDTWAIEGMASDTMAAYISYPEDRSDHTFSVYVNRPGLSFGYFFRGGGDIDEVDRSIAEFTVAGYPERAFISMNHQKVDKLQIDDGNTLQVMEIDESKPFAIVLPVNAGILTFLDVNGNVVNYLNHPL